MKPRATLWLCILGVIAAALFLRGGDLPLRPLHNDEAINAFKLRALWAGEGYRYDAHEYHGPTLYFLALPVLKVASWFHPDQPDEAAMRMVTVLVGMGLVGVTLLAWRSLGWGAALAGALGVAVSPSMVYFSRYFIHELMLVLFTGCVLLAVAAYRRRIDRRSAVWVGVWVGMMYATKETFVFAILAMAVGGVLTAWAGGPDALERVRGGTGWGARVRSLGRVFALIPLRHVFLAVGVFAVVAGAFFTSFGRNPAGAWDAVRTYLIWGERAGGATPHVHPWWFYFQRVFWFRFGNGPLWTEALIGVLAVVGVVLGWKSGAPSGAGGVPVRFLAGYTAVLAVVYAAIPYKTPWCLLGFHHGFILLAGVGVARLAAMRPGRVWRGAVVACGLAGALHLGWQSWRANEDYPADFRNPHVYGHTSMDVLNLLELVEGVAAAQPEGLSTPLVVSVPESDYWPLPWYLRRYDRAGWFDRMPERLEGGVVISAMKLRAGLEESGAGRWVQVGMFELRPRYFVEVHVETVRWKRFLATRAQAGATSGPSGG